MILNRTEKSVIEMKEGSGRNSRMPRKLGAEEVEPQPVRKNRLARARMAFHRITIWIKRGYGQLKIRYGPRYTHSMVVVGFFALFLPIPGSSVVGVALVVLIAEIHRVFFKGGYAGLRGRRQKLTLDRGEEPATRNLLAIDDGGPQTVATPGSPRPGIVRRMLTRLGRVLKRMILGKSSHDYMKQFCRGDEYWDRVITADRRAPRGIVLSYPAPEYEPVFGWTKRQLDDYLARNPGYRPTYEAELHKRRGEEVNEADDGQLH